MSFIVDDDPKFTRPVKVRTPEGDGYREEEFTATFRSIDVDEAASFDLGDNKGSSQFLQRVLVRMDGLVTRDKEPLDYSEELRDRVLQRGPVRAALARVYFTAQNQAELGN